MKRNVFSQWCSITMVMAVILLLLNSCNSSTRSSFDEIKNNKLSSGSLYSDRELLQGLHITPDKSINQQEFSRQYHLRNTWWREAFNFLKTNNLKTLAPAKYIIDSGNVFAIVWEGIPQIKDSVLWEAHHDFNDLQYIICGKVEMGIAPIQGSNKNVTFPYTKEEDIEHYEVTSGDEYYLADSSTFFIFSPKEMHRPAIRTGGRNPIKKIIIKVRVP